MQAPASAASQGGGGDQGGQGQGDHGQGNQGNQGQGGGDQGGQGQGNQGDQGNGGAGASQASGNGNGNGNGGGHAHGHHHDNGASAGAAASSSSATTTPTQSTLATTPPTPTPVATPTPVVTPAPSTPVATPTPTVTPVASPLTGPSVGLRDRRVTTSPRVGPGGLALGAAGTTAGRPLTASAPITGTLAPGTAGIAVATTTTTAAARSTSQRSANHSHHPAHGLLPLLGAPASLVIDHFIKVIPFGVWIALAVALGLAAAGGGAALLSARRARLRAGEVAAATAEVAAVTAAALTDPLTGVLNRRGFSQAAERELSRARRYEHAMALAFVDVRGLKAVNDSEGHLAGDRLLKQVALLLRDSARTHDVVGRIGGDELAVLLVEQSGDGASAMSDRVRAEIPAHRAELGLRTNWDVTIGAAAFPSDGDSIEQLLEVADRRLYEQRGIELGNGDVSRRPAHS